MKTLLVCALILGAFVVSVLYLPIDYAKVDVTRPHNPPLHDGRWGEYNEGMAEQCAHAAMLQGVKHKLSNEAISALFNQCVFDQGLTI